MSALNRGTATGRIARDPHVAINSDGSKTVLFTLLVDRARRNPTTGERGTDAIPLVAWVRAETEGTGPWAHVGTGDLIQVEYSVRSGSYPDKVTGEIKYSMQLSVSDMAFLESRAVTQQRRIAHLKSALEGPQATQQAQAAPKVSTRRQKATAAA